MVRFALHATWSTSSLTLWMHWRVSHASRVQARVMKM